MTNGGFSYSIVRLIGLMQWDILIVIIITLTVVGDLHDIDCSHPHAYQRILGNHM